MITREQTDIILRPETQKSIRENLDRDPAEVALRVKDNGLLVSTQVKYLRRARTKLPSYYEARCVIEPLAFEQCSSERTAQAKEYKGKLCIDLTCGLGVDSRAFSKKFDRVIAVERNADLCYLTGRNFGLLGAGNIELHNTTAEAFLTKFDGLADMIYIDPARRGDDGSKLYLLEHCSPNVVAMLPELLKKTRLLVIKASPLFDIDEAFRIFGSGITVEAVSVGGECKELIIEVRAGAVPNAAPNSASNTGTGVTGLIKATIAGEGTGTGAGAGTGASACTEQFTRSAPEAPALPVSATAPATRQEAWRYLLIPDVTLYKTRTVKEYAARNGFCCPSVGGIGYCFAQQEPERFFGQTHEIEEVIPYQPKKLKARLKAANITRADILKKDFPYNAAQIAHSLGIKEGGARKIAFTTIGNALYALLLK